MTTFDKREEAFERMFAHDEAKRFRAISRRNKMLGQWAAAKLGKTGADADGYVAEVIRSDFEEHGDHDVLRKIHGDFEAAGVNQSEHQIRRTMDEFLARAMDEVAAEG